MPPDSLRRVIADIACAIGGHRFVVWARTCEPVARHPHLGAWARCDRCGHERDWRVGNGGPDERVLDLVHMVVRPMREIQAIARGERAQTPPATVPAAAPTGSSSRPLRPMRRRSAEGRGSSRRTPRSAPRHDHDPPER